MDSKSIKEFFNKPFVANGIEAPVASYPGIVRIDTYGYIIPSPEGFVGQHGTCGGTRISENYIVTAAHCVDEIHEAVVITYGVSNAASTNTERGLAVVNEASCHGGYTRQGLKNDIAVIDISSPDLKDLRDNVPIVEIKDVQQIYEQHGERTTFEIAGWGLVDGNSQIIDGEEVLPIPSETLRRGTVKFVRYGPTIIDTKPSGIPATSICGGDSGGPLYWTDESGIKYLTGIVSSESTNEVDGSQSCKQPNNATFTNIWGYIGWLKSLGAID